MDTTRGSNCEFQRSFGELTEQALREPGDTKNYVS
jgi:hypothetical protein